MRQRTLSNRANPATLKNEAELITNLITDSTLGYPRILQNITRFFSI